MANVSVQHLSGLGIRDFNLEVADRELAVLAGPNGFGGEAVLLGVAGAAGGLKGEVSIGEKRVESVAARDRDVAILFRHDALYPRMSVRENLAFALTLRKFPKREIERRITETAEVLGIGDWLDRKPGALSEAQRRRVALGRAIARQPKVFLLDEPLAGLGPIERAEMRAEILRLHYRLQATMIYATSDSVEALTMATRLVVMNEGIIHQTGAPMDVYREPANLFVAGWLGRPPMNLIRGKLRDAGEALVFKECGEGVIEIKLAGRPEARVLSGLEIVAGIRAEDVRIVQEPARPGAMRFRALLDVVESMGAESIAHIETGAHRILARTARPLAHDEAGHRVQFEIDPASVHLFDPETNCRIGLRSAEPAPETAGSR